MSLTLTQFSCTTLHQFYVIILYFNDTQKYFCLNQKNQGIARVPKRKQSPNSFLTTNIFNTEEAPALKKEVQA